MSENSKRALMKEHLSARAYTFSKYSVGDMQEDILSNSFEEINNALVNAIP